MCQFEGGVLRAYESFTYTAYAYISSSRTVTNPIVVITKSIVFSVPFLPFLQLLTVANDAEVAYSTSL